jgi:hypothetical protein
MLKTFYVEIKVLSRLGEIIIQEAIQQTSEVAYPNSSLKDGNSQP